MKNIYNFAFLKVLQKANKDHELGLFSQSTISKVNNQQLLDAVIAGTEVTCQQIHLHDNHDQWILLMNLIHSTEKAGQQTLGRDCFVIQPPAKLF